MNINRWCIHYPAASHPQAALEAATRCVWNPFDSAQGRQVAQPTGLQGYVAARAITAPLPPRFLAKARAGAALFLLSVLIHRLSGIDGL
ncbi:MAG TPA: hypothetical protein VMW72_25325 [Sedimentisphaerales bacterium]|nr:hypothetical protein [Sedimentisphaerales bacterium]